ncbi:hypothetical protein N7450_011731 [Penicillium hetheringtonii]|uniref:Uncharacterized protein n=1 Tax=Penicillium hetheringtonii TaxID=911720 RepID=A0AAD6DAL0_9EURO|nr:hypothetical protein N7450_011731 [Penicillium hetheringtonii]
MTITKTTVSSKLASNRAIKQTLSGRRITNPPPVSLGLVQLHVRWPLAVSVPTAKAYNCALEDIRPLPQPSSLITHGRCKATIMTFLTSNRDISWPPLRNPTGPKYTELSELSWTLMIDRSMWRRNLLTVLKSRRRTKAGE